MTADETTLETAELRDGETKDVDSHARRNLAQLKQAADEIEADGGDVPEPIRDRLDGTGFELTDDDDG